MLPTTLQTLLHLPIGRYVPVWIDDIKVLEGFPVARCVYLSLTVDSSKQENPLHIPLPEGSLGPDVGELGLLVLSLEAIVTRPATGVRFESAADFADLFDRLERGQGWDLELGFVWLPNSIIEPALEDLDDTPSRPDAKGPDAKGPDAKGHVLRVEANLFLEALAASIEERVPSGTPFVERALADRAIALESVRPSPIETKALLEFSKAEVAAAGRQLKQRETETDDEVLLWVHPEEGPMRGDRALGKDYGV